MRPWPIERQRLMVWCALRLIERQRLVWCVLRLIERQRLMVWCALRLIADHHRGVVPGDSH